MATLGVLGWRLVNFWLPIPTGAIAYVSLKVEPHSGAAGIWRAFSGLLPTGKGKPRASDALQE